MRIPTLEEELEEIVADADALGHWTENVKQQVRKAIDRLRESLVLAERENAVRVCEELSREYLARGDGHDHKFKASAALEAGDRIRIGRRAVAQPDPNQEALP